MQATTRKNTHQNSGLLWLLIKLTALIILIQAWGMFLHVLKPILRQNLIVNFTPQILKSWPVMLDFAHYATAQVLLYAIFIAIIWLVTCLVQPILKFPQHKLRRYGFWIWLLGIVTIFLANQYLFPWSAFAALPKTPWSLQIIKYVLWFCLFLCGLLGLVALLGGIKLLYQRFKLLGLASAATAILIVIGAGYIGLQPQTVYIEKSIRPNVIIIGIDSLRPDHLHLAPHITKFLQAAVRFTHSYTPQARTFVAWMSILTGKDPKLTGVRFDSANITDLTFPHNLAKTLQKMGYTTLYATDDRRFNRITPTLGFNAVIAPKTGFNDFILGSINDFPLSNLVINAKLGHFLFPYSYANRSAYKTYEPRTFVHWLHQSLAQFNHRPLFLSAHLCLPHWPFIWAKMPYSYAPPTPQRAFLFYKMALGRVDQQFASLIQTLRQAHLLQHAIVVVLSDHGHGFGLPNERATALKGYIPGKTKITKRALTFFTQPTYGHGTDILNLAQENNVLAFRTFGFKPNLQPKKIKHAVSLIDIKPTLLAMLGQADPYAQGVSVWPLLNGRKKTLPKQTIFIESGFTVPGVLVADPSIEKVLQQGYSYFYLDSKTGAVYIKKHLGKLIIQGKQRGVIRYPWILTYYRGMHNQRMIIIANMQTHQWTTDLTSQFAQKGQALKLLHALKQFYGNELD